MIWIETNRTNYFTLELRNTLPSTDEYFLFEFIFEGTTERESQWFTAPDLGLSYQRYSIFKLEESWSAPYTEVDDSPINLTTGQYRVRIYADSLPWYFFSPWIPPTEGAHIQEVRCHVAGWSNVNPVYNGLQEPPVTGDVYA
jgi:hypothetical protein